MNKKKILLMLSVLAISAATALSITACNPTSKHGDDEHSYEWTTQTPATCTTPGTDIGVCECGDSVTRTVQPLGHDYVWTDLTDADCTHLATEKGVCRRDGCGNETARDKEGSTALGHDLVTVVLKPATCEEDGSQQVQCKRDGCDYKEAETTITALNHDYKWEHLSDATCDEPAKEKGVCQNDITHTLVRNKEGSTKLGHDIEGLEWVITKPEAQKEGKAVKVCKRDENHVIEIILPKTTETSKYKTFDIVYDSEDVNKDGTATIVYNDPVHGDIEFTISVPPCAHQSEDAIYRTLQPATCEEDGEEEAICPDCGFPVRRAIVAPGHKYPENWTVITTPKASTTGKATKTCTRDSSHKLEVIIPALNEAVAAGARAEGNYTVVETPVGKLTYGSKTYTYIDPEYPDDPVIFTVKNTANDVDKDPELIELLKTAKQYRDQVISITRNGEVIYEAHLPNYMYVNSDEGNGNKYWFVLDGEGKYTTDGTSKYANSNGIILPITAA